MGRSQSTTRDVLRVVLIVVCVAAALYVAYLLRQPLAWLVVAAFIAVAVSGPVNILSRRMKRGFAIALVYLGLILVPVAVAAIVVPPLVSQADGLIGSAPQYAADVTAFVQSNGLLNDLEERFDITSRLQEQAAELPSKIGDAASTVRDLGVGVVNSVFAAVTILILSVFMVGGNRRWIGKFLEQQPPDRAEGLRRAFDRMGSAVGNYVGGALLQSVIAGTTTFVVLLILGVPFAAPLAVVVALLDLIPLVGATLGAIIVGIVTLFTDFPTATIVWAIWAVIYQQVENNLIQPQIQRRAVQVEPFVVLVSVLFGSALFGVVGALLAVPVAASGQIALREYLAYRRDDHVAGASAPATAATPAGTPADGGQRDLPGVDEPAVDRTT